MILGQGAIMDGRRGTDLIDTFVVGGQVGPEQPFCDRQPAPFHCSLPPGAPRTLERRVSTMCSNTTVACSVIPEELRKHEHAQDLCPIPNKTHLVVTTGS